NDKTVTCPWHAWCFSLQTGRMVLGDMGGVETFDVRVDDGHVAVKITPRVSGS
ncbi:MAG: nitrite reductase (NAD(P)H) small subunit, partial [Candidatus Eremiobacteraeota bacterium]|nr:nitrite reductase (NAD(P)H) small subunit [Candidatus Eremiobacteraeota bacterium]